MGGGRFETKNYSNVCVTMFRIQGLKAFFEKDGCFELIQNFVILWASVVVTAFLEVGEGVLNKYKI